MLIFCIPLLGILAGYFLMTRQVTISVDGKALEVTTRAITVRGALRTAGIKLDPADRVVPSASSWLSKTSTITVERARTVQVWNDGTDQLIVLNTPGLTPAEMLVAAGILPTAEDALYINGLRVALDEQVGRDGMITLQYIPAVSLTVTRDGQNTTFRTAAPTLGQALWARGIRLHGGDALNQTSTHPVDPQASLVINSAVPLVITSDGRDITTFAAATTVGEALAMSGVSLQDLDYSIPAETEPLPESGRIEVVRVREEILLEQQNIPYTTETTTDPTLSLDQEKVITAGEFGIQAVRVRVRYENGVEISRQTENTIVLKEPVTEVVAYGAGVDVKTLDTPNGTITYYRAMEVTATSYSPCNSGADECYPLTASGTTVQRGVLAVHSDWYKLLKGSDIYIPGYGIGTVLDIGSYPYNHNWIDLGYTDEEFAQVTTKTFLNITVYFLMPYPSSGPVVLP